MRTQRLLPILVIAGSVILVVIVSVLIGPPPPAPRGSTDARATTFSAGPNGTKAIFLVLEHFLPHVERWLRPLSTLAAPGTDAADTLLVMQPLSPLSEREAEALDAWIAAGGQLIVAAGSPWEVEGGVQKGDFLAGRGFTTEQGTLSSHVYSGGGGVMLLEGTPLSKGNYEPLFSGPSGTVGARRDIGTGRMIVITDGFAWSNDRLSRSTNAAWIVRAAGGWRNGRLAVDEYHLGRHSRFSAQRLAVEFLGSSWGFAFLQAGCAGAFLLLGRRRFGPAIDLPREDVQDPLERVRGIGALLRAANAQGFAAQVTGQLAAARQHGRTKRHNDYGGQA